MYKAKVIKSNKSGYYLHWLGWNSKWDSWVEFDEAFEFNEENVLKMQTNNRNVKQALADAKKKPKKRPGPPNQGKQAKKKKEAPLYDDTVELDSEVPEKKELKMKIPGQIKKFLISDWENITRSKLLVKLPAKFTVSSIFNDYLASKTKSKDKHDVLQEVVVGLKEYFNRSLGVILLYRFERPQYNDQLKEVRDKTAFCAADVYGPEHLARLFVKLPDLIAHTHLTCAEKTLLQNKIGDFLKWFAKKAEYFSVPYVTTDRDYHLRVEV